MNQQSMEEIAKDINDITLSILLPARAEKKVDEKSFAILFEYLEEVRQGIEGKPMISRKLTGILFFIYVSLSAEASYCDKTSLLFRKVAELESMLDDIFDIPL